MQKTFTRRVALLAGGQALLFSALVGRMYYLQVVQTDRFRLLAEENRVNLHLLPPLRGKIVDRFGTPLAINDPNYRVVIVPEQTASMRETLATLGADPAARRPRRSSGWCASARSERAFLPITVKRQSRLGSGLPDRGQSRPIFPAPASRSTRAAPIPTAAPPPMCWAMSERRRRTRSATIRCSSCRASASARAGWRRSTTRKLRGTAGTSEVEVNALGRVIRELDRRDGQPGVELVSTLDIGLQEFVQQRLAVAAERLVGGDRRLHRRCAGHGLDAQLRSRDLQSRAQRRRLADASAPIPATR